MLKSKSRVAMLSCSSVLVICLVLGLGSTSSIDNCPPNLPRDKFLQYFQGICYEFVVTTYHHFYTSIKECSQKGGLLVQIKSEEINSFIQKELHDTYNERYDTWIGLDDANRDGKFYWVDGSDVEYENWAPNEGERFHIGADACATIDPVNGTWIDYPCQGFIFEEVKPYICQFNAIQPSTTQAPTTESPTTQAPTTESPTTQAPTTESPTTQAPTTESPSTQAPTTESSEVCPAFSCDLDCGIEGYITDENGCSICKCNE